MRRQKNSFSKNTAPKVPGHTNRRWARIFLTVIALGLVLTFVALVLYLQGAASSFSSGDKGKVVEETRQELNQNPSPTSLDLPPDQYTGPDKQNIILVGSDTRGEEKGRADTVLLLHLDHKRHYLGVLSLPRDLRVDIPGYGQQKINAAYSYGGMPLLVATVRENFGVKIDHFAIIDFRTFREAVDAIGGMYLPIDHRYYNKNIGTAETNYADIDLMPGYQHLDGRDVLSWVRYRHTDTDFVRSARQTIFLGEFKAAWVDQQSLGTLDEIIKVAGRGVTSDLDRIDKIGGLLWAISQVRSSNINRVEIPTTSSGSSDLIASETVRKDTVLAWLGNKVSGGNKPKGGNKTSSGGNLSANVNTSLTAQTAAGMGQINIVPPCKPSYRRHQDTAQEGRSYKLDGGQAWALPVKNTGFGSYYLWMWADKKAQVALPIFQRSLSKTGVYDYYQRGTSVLYMAKKLPDGSRVWIHNTLQNDLSKEDMKTLLDGCN